jgi:hypothetical protein
VTLVATALIASVVVLPARHAQAAPKKSTKSSTKKSTKKTGQLIEARSNVAGALTQRADPKKPPATPCDTAKTAPCPLSLYGILYVTPMVPTIIAKLTQSEIANKYWFAGQSWDTENGTVVITPDGRKVVYTQQRPAIGDQYIWVDRCNSRGCATMVMYVEVESTECTITDDPLGTAKYAGTGAVVLLGTPKDDIFCLDQDYADVVLGFGGDDIFLGGNRPILVVPGAGNNFIDSFDAVIAPTNGNDVMHKHAPLYKGPMPKWQSAWSESQFEEQTEFIAKLKKGELPVEEQPKPEDEGDNIRTTFEPITNTLP